MTFNWFQKERMNGFLKKKLSDTVADFVGSWAFIIIHIAWFAGWFLLEVEPFPYGFLTLTVSLEAIFLTTLVMMSENRQMERDRTQAEADYETNIEAKEEIEDIQRRLARIEDEKLDKILSLLERKG